MTDTLPPASDQPDRTLPEKEVLHKGGAPRGNTNASRHGAPLGNTNALKHGFFSRSFKLAERNRLEHELQGELKDEEECLRLVIRRYIDSLDDEDQTDQVRYLLAVRTISLGFGRIESLQRTRRLIYETQSTLDQVYKELKLIPPEQDEVV